MSTRKYIRVIINSPEIHTSYTVNCEWNLSIEKFKEIVHNIMDNDIMPYMTPGKFIGHFPCYERSYCVLRLDSFGILDVLHFSGQMRTNAVDSIKTQRHMSIIFQLVAKSKSRTNKTKRIVESISLGVPILYGDEFAVNFQPFE